MIGLFLKRRCQLDQSSFLKMRSNKLQPDRELVSGKTCGNCHARQTRHIDRNCENIGKIHLNRVIYLLADPKCRRRRGGTEDGVTSLEGLLEVSSDQCA